MTDAPVIRDPVFMGHMWDIDNEHAKAVAGQIFCECWAIGKCECLWVIALQVLIGLAIGRGFRWRGLELCHVYGSRERQE